MGSNSIKSNHLPSLKQLIFLTKVHVSLYKEMAHTCYRNILCLPKHIEIPKMSIV